MGSKYLFVILGPTGVGKTELALHLAVRLGAPIVSADARQLYKELNIGVAKPSQHALVQLAQHHLDYHFISSHSMLNPLSAGAYEKECLLCLERLFRQHHCVLLVGGSGLYVQAVCQGLSPLPSVPVSIQKKWQHASLDTLQAYVRQHDPQHYERMDTQNPRRLMRAAALIQTHNQPYSTLLRAPKRRNFTLHAIGLHAPRTQLYDRINARCTTMLKQGLYQEAQTLHAQYIATRKPPVQIPRTIGYQEFFDHIEGQYNWTHAQQLFFRNSRRYAKRQLTWLRKQEDIPYFGLHEKDAILTHIDTCLQQ